MKPVRHKLPIDLAKYRAHAAAFNAWCLTERLGYTLRHDPLAGWLPHLLFDDAELLARVESAWATRLI